MADNASSSVACAHFQSGSSTRRERAQRRKMQAVQHNRANIYRPTNICAQSVASLAGNKSICAWRVILRFVQHARCVQSSVRCVLRFICIYICAYFEMRSHKSVWWREIALIPSYLCERARSVRARDRGSILCARLYRGLPTRMCSEIKFSCLAFSPHPIYYIPYIKQCRGHLVFVQLV